mgnify:CR=1 FL=1
MKNRYVNFWAIGLLWLVSWAPPLSAQSIPQSLEEAKGIVNDRKLKINGGVNASQIFYAASGVDSRRNPYAYFVSGNLNFSMFSLSIPITFTFTNQTFNYNYQLPTFDFNQFGMQPTWKWVKLYAGYNTMSFSPYTLNGALFLGGGVELTPPGHFEVSAMYGRLRKPQAYDPTAEALNNQQAPFAYRRMGYGTKITYKFKSKPRARKIRQPSIESKYDKDGGLKPAPPPPPPAQVNDPTGQNDQISLIVFAAHDDIGSVPPPPDSVLVNPESNLALSLQLSKSLGKRITFNGEIASSALTQDTRIQTPDEATQTVFVITDAFFRRKSSTAYYNAYKGNIDYNAGAFTIGLGYERVDPEYRTLGAYYFNSDLENMTVNFTTQLFRNKVSIATNIGTQRNNLNDDQLATLRRISGSANISFTPSPKLNFNVSYSNFQSLTRIRSQFQQINQLTPLDNIGDTLNLDQISQNANLNANFNLVSTPQQQQMLSLNATYQQADNEQGGNTIPGTRFYQLTSTYNISWTPLDMSASLAFNYNQNVAENLDNRTLGPTLSLNKSLFKKQLALTLSASFNQAFTNGNQNNQIVNARIGASYAWMKKHRFTLSTVFLNQQTSSENATRFAEFTGTLNYSYSF